MLSHRHRARPIGVTWWLALSSTSAVPADLLVSSLPAKTIDGALPKVNTILLKDAERVVRITMIVILFTAGTSKFFSQGGFLVYYSALFQSDLRINLPPILVDSYLRLIPFIEIGVALALLTNRLKRYVVYGWFSFFLSLLFGHYILQDWSSVNQILDYMFLGILCLLLPTHRSWLRRDRHDDASWDEARQIYEVVEE